MNTVIIVQVFIGGPAAGTWGILGVFDSNELAEKAMADYCNSNKGAKVESYSFQVNKVYS